MSLLREFLSFLGSNKKYWLIPLIIVVALLAAISLGSSGTTIAPFRYSLF